MTVRVGIVLAGPLQPAWIRRVIEHVRDAHTLTFITFAEGVETAALGRRSLFHRIDELLYSADGLDLAPVSPLAHAAAPADVILAFAPFTRPDTEVWTVERSGFDAFAAGAPHLEAVLRSNGEVIASVTAMPDAISFRRAMSRLGWRTASMIIHELDAERRPRRRMRQRPAAAPRSARSPLLRSAVNYVKQQFRDRFTRVQWSIAFTFSDPLHLSGYVQCIPPRDRLWADPFVISDNGKAWIFLEEYVYTEARGVISVIEARRDGTWTQPRRVLERPYHLSYPCVFRWNGNYWMVPETQENRTIELYRCVDFPMRWELDTVLFRDVNAVDATVFEHDGRWWMYYATDSGDAAGFDRLWAFHAASPQGPWIPHRLNPLECDVFGGRPGGRPFVHQGKVVRATQVGAPWYGHAMQLRELVALTPEQWDERAIATIGPEWFPHGTGTHTLNADGDCAVVDAVRRRLRRSSEPAP
ncbi:MAG TPA: hypothetical protein VEK11_16385 [Thermoanaerobaculia bacterium]|nr:hypothetical protein [Thermoanaerobaculia bacterium]